jgi:UDP-glucose 4-epimerase
VAKVLVIGGNGFIGAHLVDALVIAKHDVTVFDRFSNGGPSYRSTGVRAITGDFLNRAAVRRAVGGNQIVFHLLSTTTPATADADATLDLRTNVIPSVELFEECVSAGVEHVFFASTGGAIYGGTHEGLLDEYAPTLPMSPYAIGKLAIENTLGFFESVHHLRSTSLRLSNPYGPGQRARRGQGLIPIAISAVLEGGPVVRFGDGTMVRDYIYVNDLVEMVVRMVGTTPIYPVYNIGGGRGASVNEVFTLVRRVMERDFAIEVRAVPSTFVQSVVLDSTRYQREFGVVELVPLEEGIRLTYQSLRSKNG